MTQSPLSFAVVPRETILPAPQRLPARHDGFEREPGQFAPAVEPQLPVAGEQGVAVKDHDRSPVAASDALQAPEEVDFLAGVEFLAESAYLAECRRLAKHER